MTVSWPIWAILVLAVVAVALGILLGAASTRSRAERRLAEATADAATARAQLAVSTEHWQARLAAAEQGRAREGDLAELIGPVRSALQDLGATIDRHQSARSESQGRLESHVKELAASQREVVRQSHQVAAALKHPGVRGRWGEVQLTRIMETAGLLEGITFHRQVGAAGGRLRPDMVVDLGGGRQVVIDSKVPLDALLDAYGAAGADPEAPVDGLQLPDQQALRAHAAAVRGRVKELAAKEYAAQFDQAPDFVVLFLPAEDILGAALASDPTLIDDAFQAGVVLATPTTLLSLLRVVSLAWREHRAEENAQELLSLATLAVERVAAVAGHLQALGARLGATVEAYNKVAGSWQSRLRPVARRIDERGLDIPGMAELVALDGDVRRVDRLTDTA